MITLIRSWLIGVLCASMVVAVAEHLMPPGAVRKIGKITAGLVLLLAIVQPFLNVDAADLTQGFSLEEYRAQMSEYDSTLEEENLELMKDIIAEQVAAYIVDKAAGMGISCTAEVTLTEDAQGNALPYSVIVVGALTPAQRNALTGEITAELAIPSQRQYYEDGDIS